MRQLCIVIEDASAFPGRPQPIHLPPNAVLQASTTSTNDNRSPPSTALAPPPPPGRRAYCRSSARAGGEHVCSGALAPPKTAPWIALNPTSSSVTRALVPIGRPNVVVAFAAADPVAPLAWGPERACGPWLIRERTRGRRGGAAGARGRARNARCGAAQHAGGDARGQGADARLAYGGCSSNSHAKAVERSASRAWRSSRGTHPRAVAARVPEIEGGALAIGVAILLAIRVHGEERHLAWTVVPRAEIDQAAGRVGELLPEAEARLDADA